MGDPGKEEPENSALPFFSLRVPASPCLRVAVSLKLRGFLRSLREVYEGKCIFGIRHWPRHAKR